MVDWNYANGMQMRMLHDALLDAFRNPSDLKKLLRLNLDESYAEHVMSGGNYANEVFDVVQAARQDAWLTHDANTLHGSSRSPCLNAKLELVALHNAGDPMYDDGNGAPKQKQAVPLEPILASIDATANAPKFWSA